MSLKLVVDNHAPRPLSIPEPQGTVEGPGATTVDGAVSEIAAGNPMRVLVRRACKSCRHEWTQPAAKGACPKCGSLLVTNLSADYCSLPRM